MWDERYSGEEYAYGTEPNDFLVEHAASLPAGEVLCVGEGEGRNAVWLARQGYRVTAVDASAVGLEKARRLADRHGVTLETVQAELAAFDFGRDRWSGIVSIFCHVPPPVRRRMHAALPGALAPGGTLLLEAYTPRQLEFATGGPPVAEMMMTLDELQSELPGLQLLHAAELEREVREGRFHTGRGAVVQLVARRPEYSV